MKRIQTVIDRIDAVLDRFMPVSVAHSGGKDSSVVGDAVLAALVRRKRDGKPSPPVLFTHADPGIENPEMRLAADSMLDGIRQVAARFGLDATVKTAVPALNATWAVRILGGRGLPPFPENAKGRDCTTDFKVRPQDGLRKAVRAEYGQVVVMTGTRFAESSVRAAKMSARGEDPDRVWEKDGDLFASPIADWDDADIWRHLSAPVDDTVRMVDTKTLSRVYLDGSTETVFHDEVPVPQARFGCCVCTAGVDKSMAALVGRDPARYGYMKGLLDLQRFILDTRRMPRLRHWPGRTIQNGFMAFGPDVYSPAMTRALYRYCLSLDADEIVRTGNRPRFTLVPREAALMIDAMWSMYGFQKPFAGLSDWRMIHHGGRRFFPPAKVRPAAGKMPGLRYLHVGRGWNDPRYDSCGVSGGHQLLDPETCHMGMVPGPSGSCRPGYQWERAVSVDPVGVAMFDDYMADDLVREYRSGKLCHSVRGWEEYAMCGAMTVPDRAVSHLDRMARRTVWRRERSMTGQMGKETLSMLLSQTVSAVEMKQGRRVP